MKFTGRSLLTWLDYTKEEFLEVLQLAKTLKKDKKLGIVQPLLKGKQVVLLFQKDSTRTRCAFEVAANDLGMQATYIGSSGSQMGVKESIPDTARVLGRMYQGIEFRGYDHRDAMALAKYANVPVWNGLTDKYHPTQVLADFLTIEEKFQRLEGLTLAYFGDAHNNVANSLMIGASLVGMHFRAVAPKSLWPEETLIATCKKLAEASGGSITLCEDPVIGATGADVLYTDVWVSMGEAKDVWAERIKLLTPYQVNRKLMNIASKNAIFLHCLPAFHGIDTEIGQSIAKQFGAEYPLISHGEMEVTNEVFVSSQSLVFEQAENRMHTIKAIMLATLS